MRGVRVFDENAEEYDRWFDAHPRVYQAETSALRKFVPTHGSGIEIGVGTGRFAAPLGITLGVEPSERMARLAQRRGISVCQAIGERMPFRDAQFDFALMVTVICFVENVEILLRETRRVLKTSGRLILGFIDRQSALGQLYESRKGSDKFYRAAQFYSVDDVLRITRQAGFGPPQICQTLAGSPDEPKEDVRNGYGDGAFVVMCAANISSRFL
jgi:SAM-dependent methyltransferase